MGSLVLGNVEFACLCTYEKGQRKGPVKAEWNIRNRVFGVGVWGSARIPKNVLRLDKLSAVETPGR